MKTCVIWGTSVIEEKPRTGDFRIINSPRAGGWYYVDSSAESMLSALTPREKRAVMRWLVSQRSTGDRIPKLTPSTLEFARAVPPMKFTAKVNALLLTLGGTWTVSMSGFKSLRSKPPRRRRKS